MNLITLIKGLYIQIYIFNNIFIFVENLVEVFIKLIILSKNTNEIIIKY